MAKCELDAKAIHDRRVASDARVDAIVTPLATAKWSADYVWGGIESALGGFAEDFGGMNLEPAFQRGRVWSVEQQTRFIENVFKGVVTEAGLIVQFNCPHWDDDKYAGELPREIQCLDGLQRLTAVRRYVAGELRPFGQDISFFDHSRYDVRRMSRFRLKFAMHTFQDKAGLLGYYLDINGGGTPHSQAELDRVRALLHSESML